MSQPQAYPHAPDSVEVIETHMSWVFLAGDTVFKLKKPRRSRHFDFTTLGARLANCRTELKLNRRLADETYLGISRLVLTFGGDIALDTDGEVVEWLVRMRRLPSDLMLDQLIAKGAVGQLEIERICNCLAGFYGGLLPAGISAQAYCERFVAEQAINHAVFTAYPGRLPAKFYRILRRMDAALAQHRPLLEERVRSGRIIDGHGDLRPEHICLWNSVQIFDCLEFSDNLRLVDPVDELAFLGLETAHAGNAWLGPAIADCVNTRLGENVPSDLANLYTANRACLRARLSLAHLQDPAPRTPERWLPNAERYLETADAAIRAIGI